MNTHFAFCRRIALLAAILLLPGCGQVVEQAQTAARRDATRNDLKELTLAFHNFHDRENRAATSWDELQQAGLTAATRQRLEAEGYVLVLGVGFREATVGTANFVFAYPANPTGDHAVVATMDGAVHYMPVGEMRQALSNQQQNMANAVVVQPSPSAAAAASTPGAPSAPTGGSSTPPPPPPPR